MKKNKLESILLKNNSKSLSNERDVKLFNKDKLKKILYDKKFEKIKESKKYLDDAKKFLESWDKSQFKDYLYHSKKIFESFYKSNIRNEDIYSGYAECLYIMGDYKKANSIYDEGLSLFPNNFELKKGKKHVKSVLDSLNNSD